MEIVLKRLYKKDEYTIGKLYINGEYFCDTLEDKVRDLNKDGDLNDEGEGKVYGKTAIPYGRYKVVTNILSPKYAKRSSYIWCGGYLPRLINVPAYDGVLIHIGNYPKDTEGCILVGKNTKVGAVLESTTTFKALYEKLKSTKEDIYITIK